MARQRHAGRSPLSKEEADRLAAQAADTDTEAEPEPEKPATVDQGARMRSLRVRTSSTVLMIAGFLGVIWAGHVPLMGLVLVCQFLVAKELFRLAAQSTAERKLPGFRMQQWYFFMVAVFWLYCRFINKNLLVEVTSDKRLSRIFYAALKHHSLISYSLYVGGFVMFVLSLRKSRYMYQFGQYAWTHMILLVTTVPSSFFVANIFSGIFWYICPCFLIIANDIFAYLAGFFFGRTPLIKLSPKKTWEGFFGGFLGTLAFGFWFSSVLAQYDWMVCPRKDLTVFGPLHCPRDPVYVPHTYTMQELTATLPDSWVEALALAGQQLPPGLRTTITEFTIRAAPIQWHTMALGAFASIIGPFGGFFASGFKRSFKIKDFGDTIPGHGGVTDRLDCQILMAIFSYCYYWSYVSVPDVTVGDALSLVSRLSDTEQLLLFSKLGNLLAGEGLIPGKLWISSGTRYQA